MGHRQMSVAFLFALLEGLYLTLVSVRIENVGKEHDSFITNKYSRGTEKLWNI